eukprot:scaffold87251_cov31-Tisochrysis_lutea.AAC.2
MSASCSRSIWAILRVLGEGWTGLTASSVISTFRRAKLRGSTLRSAPLAGDSTSTFTVEAKETTESLDSDFLSDRRFAFSSEMPRAMSELAGLSILPSPGES